MSPRSIRRAAERKAAKLARKANRLSESNLSVLPEPSRDCEGAVSPAKLAANRANAQLSPGPTTPAGKAKSSLNAVRTGLTGRTVLLPTDDAAAYELHVARFIERHKPAGEEERNLVQSLADTEWRLLRIPSLEMGIYAVGRLEFAELFPQEDEGVRKQLIEAKVFLTYQRQLNNLSIQENRLRRQRDKDLARLRELQENRKRDEKTRARQTISENPLEELHPQNFGFVFSRSPIEPDGISTNLFPVGEQEFAATHNQAEAA